MKRSASHRRGFVGVAAAFFGRRPGRTRYFHADALKHVAAYLCSRCAGLARTGLGRGIANVTAALAAHMRGLVPPS
jgi:hypothetical protein